jgi:pyruvate/2-oxoglutarate dehydrogenase complex dihydrolipoamide acyltransferase (E2) component
VAILGVGAIRRVPVINDDGAITATNQMVLSLTFDHAVVDGAHAAAFLQQLGAAMAG